MAERIAFDVNGVLRTIEVTPQTPLLYVLRNELGLSNPHFGCGLAQCGACTVHLDGVPTRSCSLPVSAAAGTKITSDTESPAAKADRTQIQVADLLTRAQQGVASPWRSGRGGATTAPPPRRPRQTA